MAEWMKRAGHSEAEIAAALRGRAMEEIDELGPSSAAEKLGLSPDIVRRLRMRSPWSLEEAFRITSALRPGLIEKIRQVVKD